MNQTVEKRLDSASAGDWIRNNTNLLLMVALIIVGSGLLVTGFIVPPAGEIHPSVLIAFGEILTFVGALFGIDYHYKYKDHEKD